MLIWLEDNVGQEYAVQAYWAIIAIAAILALLLILFVMRRLRSGTYVAGGRNRKARLSVMDAAAIDTHRRLVLVRRDDVEHLLLIGGNSDIVVERDIRIVQGRRAVEPALEEPAPAAAQAPRPAPPAPRPVAPPASPTPAPVQARPVVAPPRPVVAPPVAVTPRAVQSSRPVSRTRDELDDDLMKELESALDSGDVPAVSPPSKPRTSLDDEMAKLLGELSSQKR